MPIETSTLSLDSARCSEKQPYIQPSLIEYGDINVVTQDLASGDLLSVTAVAVV